MHTFLLADLISRLHVGSLKNILSVNVSFSILNLRFLILLNVEGLIEGFKVFEDFVLVFLKKLQFNHFLLLRSVKLVSTPGRRCYWKLNKLSKKYSYQNFSGFYIVSSSKGLLTSIDALLKYHEGGEILLKISI